MHTRVCCLCTPTFTMELSEIEKFIYFERARENIYDYEKRVECLLLLFIYVETCVEIFKCAAS